MTTNGPCVYVVDDDASVLKALARLIASNGYAVKAFGSGEKFLETYDKDLPGCIVTDVCMPGMTGLELQKKLADMGSTMRVIFITGHDNEAARAQAFGNGAVAWLLKPVGEEELLKAIGAATQRETLNGK